MLTDLSYMKSCRIVYPNVYHNWNTFGSTRENVVPSLRRAGFRIRNRNVIKIKDFLQLKRNALIIVTHKAYGPDGCNLHAVVWDYEIQRILDPYPDLHRSLKRHLPLSSYQRSAIEITEVYS